MSYKRKRITVKIGSNVLARPDGTLDITRMSALTDQIAELHKAGVEIIVISSGAVASGRSELKIHRKLDAVSADNYSRLWGKPNSSIVITSYSGNTI